MFYFVEEIVSYTHRAGDNVLPHRHGGAEIIVYGGGEGAATVEKEEFNYSEKSLLIVPEGREHFERTLVETDVRSCVFRTDYFEIGEPVMITGAKFAPLIDRIYEILGKMSEIFLVEGVRGGAELENDLSQLLYTVRYLKEVYDGSFDTQAVALCSNAKNTFSPISTAKSPSRSSRKTSAIRTTVSATSSSRWWAWARRPISRAYA